MNRQNGEYPNTKYVHQNGQFKELLMKMDKCSGGLLFGDDMLYVYWFYIIKKLNTSITS